MVQGAPPHRQSVACQTGHELRPKTVTWSCGKQLWKAGHFDRKDQDETDEPPLVTAPVCTCLCSLLVRRCSSRRLWHMHFPLGPQDATALLLRPMSAPVVVRTYERTGTVRTAHQPQGTVHMGRLPLTSWLPWFQRGP